MSELMFAIIVDFLGVDVVTVHACFEKRIKANHLHMGAIMRRGYKRAQYQRLQLIRYVRCTNLHEVCITTQNTPHRLWETAPGWRIPRCHSLPLQFFFWSHDTADLETARYTWRTAN